MEIDFTCELGEDHIKQWLKAFRARQPDQGDTYFLWGTNEFEPDSPYPLEGIAYPKTESVRFIFPCDIYKEYILNALVMSELFKKLDLACSCRQKTTRDYKVIFTINGGVKIKFYNFFYQLVTVYGGHVNINKPAITKIEIIG